MTVKLDANALQSALNNLTGLADAIDFFRNWCIKDSPETLPSLAEGTPLTQVRDWLKDQTSTLKPIHDLAVLLGSEGSGPIEIPGTGTVDEVRKQLGAEAARQARDNNFENPDDLNNFNDVLAIVERYKDDPVVSNAFHTELGPRGYSDVMYRVRNLTEPSASIWMPEHNTTTTAEDLLTLADTTQDRFASAMAASLATASHSPDFPPNYAKELVNDAGDGTNLGLLFDYAGRNGNTFSKDFLTTVGKGLLEREGSRGGTSWGNSFGIPNQFGTADTEQVKDPVYQWMEALRLNPAASQEILLDPERAAYLLEERHYPYEKVPGAAAGDVLKSATVDQALNNNSSGENAAKISSWAINHFGGSAEPLDGAKEELGGIVAMYMRDIGRIAVDPGSNDGAGVYGPGNLPPGLLDGEGFPPYGIRVNRDAVNNLLGDLGDNDQAISIIGSASGRYTHARLSQATIAPNDDYSDTFRNTVFTNSAITGFLYDGLFDGGIADATGDAEKRRKMYQFFTMPTAYLKAGPLGSFVIGEVKSQLEKAFVGNGVSEAITNANNGYETVQQATILQSLYTLATSEDPAAEETAESIRNSWPKDASGEPKNPNDLTAEESTNLIAVVNDPADGNGYVQSVYKESLAGMDALQTQYEKK